MSEQGENIVNGEATNGEAPHKKWDVIVITGKRENCEGAKEALLVSLFRNAHSVKVFKFQLSNYNKKKIQMPYIFSAIEQNLVPITKEVSVPMDYHRFIIGMKGREVQNMMKVFDVNISIPSSDEGSDVIKIYGAPANVERAESALEEKVRQLDDQKEERVSTLVVNWPLV